MSCAMSAIGRLLSVKTQPVRWSDLMQTTGQQQRKRSERMLHLGLEDTISDPRRNRASSRTAGRRPSAEVVVCIRQLLYSKLKS
jgi:hypothetical protein